MTYGRPGVYVNETLLPAPVASAGVANAAGAAIGAFAKGPEAVTLVTSWYDFVQRFGGFNASFPATFGINQFFLNGGSELYVKRVLSAGAAKAIIDIPTTVEATNMGAIEALNRGASGNNLRVQITAGYDGVFNLFVYEEVVSTYLGTANADASNDVLVESFTNLVFNDIASGDFVETVVNNNSAYITVSITDTELTPAVQAIDAVLPLIGGADGGAVDTADYTDVLVTDGSSPFDVVDQPLVLFAPELYRKFVADNDAAADTSFVDVQTAMLEWANSGNGFAVIETLPGLTPVDAVAEVSDYTPVSQGAAYYPHYFIGDPLGRSRQALRKIGPSGAIAGLYLATDKSVGPFKTPAGTGAAIRGAVSLERAFTPKDLDILNSGIDGATIGNPVNAIRNVPGAGIVSMGGRTLLQDGTANKYINTRRSLIYIKKSLENITEFAVFQNNDYKLWAQLRTVISVFLNEYRNQGGLKGNSAPAAYWVKVDEENNTSVSIQAGQVNISVGVALEYPAEFVVINLSQITGK
jgi:phage tail sheath protein FI